MLTYAPRPTRKIARTTVLFALTFWLGLFCWTETAAAQFHFRDYGAAKPKPTPPDQIKAVGALEIGAPTGEVLHCRNAGQRLLAARTTELITALIGHEKHSGL